MSYTKTQKNIFLHFLNYDTQEVFSLTKRYTKAQLTASLVHALKIAILLCKEYTFMSLGFPYESELTRAVLQRVRPFLEEGLIRFVLRERDIEAFLSKKQSGMYYRYRNLPNYEAFFRKSAKAIFKDLGATLLARETKIGSYCIEKWEKDNLNFNVPGWKAVYSFITDRRDRRTFQKLMLSLPREYENAAFIWPSVEESLPAMSDEMRYAIRRMFESYYYQAYLEEYDASVLYDLPFSTDSFALDERWSPVCSYRCYEEWLKMIGVGPYVKWSSVDDVVALRFRPQMITLNGTYARAASLSGGIDSLREECAKIALEENTRDLMASLCSDLRIRRFAMDEKRTTESKDARINISGPIIAQNVIVGQSGGSANQNAQGAITSTFDRLRTELKSEECNDATIRQIGDIVDSIEKLLVEQTLTHDKAVGLLERLRNVSHSAFTKTVDFFKQVSIGAFGTVTGEIMLRAIDSISNVK